MHLDFGDFFFGIAGRGRRAPSSHVHSVRLPFFFCTIVAEVVVPQMLSSSILEIVKEEVFFFRLSHVDVVSVPSAS